jgi:peptidoglycan/LPS O-acetylase OafA/YrhL
MAELQSNRLDWLDAFRGWAVLGVVMLHSSQVAHAIGNMRKIADAGQYGVQLFFFVSALTISITYESHLAKFGSSVRSQFAWLTKRFFRIAPLYYLAVLFYPAERHAISVLNRSYHPTDVGISDILANIFFVHTWIPSANNSVVPGGWSIGVEAFFYVLVPFIWLIIPVQRRLVVLGIGAIACLTVSLLASRLWTGSYYVEDDSYLYFWFPAQAPVIIIGLIYHSMQGSHDRQAAPSAALCFAGFLLCFALALYLGTGSEAAPVLAPTIVGASFILLAMSLRGALKKLIVNNFAILLGKISFGVYIYHFVVLDGIRAFFQLAHFVPSGPLAFITVLATAIVVTGVISMASKRYIEDPAIAYGHQLSASVASRRVSRAI